MPNTRSWPFGSRLTADVVTVFPGASPETPKCTLLLDEFREGHVIQGVTHAIAPQKGMRVRMEFTAGEAGAGFWRIVSPAGEPVSA